VNLSIPSNPNPTWDERRVNLIKDGGRRVMYGGNAYEDDLEPAQEQPDEPEASATE
jgi:hypothetical protein